MVALSHNQSTQPDYKVISPGAHIDPKAFKSPEIAISESTSPQLEVSSPPLPLLLLVATPLAIEEANSRKYQTVMHQKERKNN